MEVARAAPQVLAGPILRRVEPGLVSVWPALSEACDVRLRVWEGRAESGRADPFQSGPLTPTLRVGARLHPAQLTIIIPAGDGSSFQADALYSYDVEIMPTGRPAADTPGAPFTLDTLGCSRSTSAERRPTGWCRGCRSASSPACCPASPAAVQPGRPQSALRLVPAARSARSRRARHGRRSDLRRRPVPGSAGAAAPAVPGWRPDLRRRRHAHAHADAAGRRSTRGPSAGRPPTSSSCPPPWWLRTVRCWRR
jgi:hypothetical protein